MRNKTGENLRGSIVLVLIAMLCSGLPCEAETIHDTLKEGEEDLKEAQTFLQENKAKEGWKTTGSGLQYFVVTEGKGPAPALDAQVKVQYRGTLVDGTQVDSSYDRGEPTTFGLHQVIKGWREGLQLMNQGARFKFVVPPDLAYGASKFQTIPPNSILLFDVELIEIIGNSSADANGANAKVPGNARTQTKEPALGGWIPRFNKLVDKNWKAILLTNWHGRSATPCELGVTISRDGSRMGKPDVIKASDDDWFTRLAISATDVAFAPLPQSFRNPSIYVRVTFSLKDP